MASRESLNVAIAIVFTCMLSTNANAALMLDFDDNDAGIVTQPGFISVTTAGGVVASDVGIGGNVTISFISDGAIDDRNRGALDLSQPLGPIGQDFIFGNRGGGATFLDVTISGIEAGNYLFTGYFHENNNGGGDATIDLDFDAGLGFLDGATVARSSGLNPAGGLGVGTFSFTSDGINDLTLRVVSDVNGHIINGLEIAAAPVPEPATATLGLIGVAGLLVRRRRAA